MSWGCPPVTSTGAGRWRSDFEFGSLIFNEVTGVVTKVLRAYNDAYEQSMQDQPADIAVPAPEGAPAPEPAPEPVPVAESRGSPVATNHCHQRSRIRATPSSSLVAVISSATDLASG